MPWFDDHPDRLEYELATLRGAGFDFEIDEVRRLAGQFCLKVPYVLDETTHQLTVVFPPDYPYFPFQVFAPTLNLSRHQDPYSKQLCFVANIDSEWNAATDTVARYFVEQLPQILAINNGKGDAKEAQEGAPVTGYLNYLPGSLVLTGQWDNISAEQERGALVIGLEHDSIPNSRLRGAVLELRDSNGDLLDSAEPAIRTRYRDLLKGRWVRLPARPKSNKPDLILSEAIGAWPVLKIPEFSGGPDVVGLVFQDEVQYKKKEDVWLFVVRVKKRYFEPHGQGRQTAGDAIICYLALPERAGRSDLQARVPRLGPLSEKKVAVVGLGALGSAMALQLARAGVGKLSLVDHDLVQAGNIARWVEGLPAVGHSKATVLSSRIRASYPFVEAQAFPFKVGAPPPQDTPTGVYEALMVQALENVDLIVDCTVEFTVQHFLSDLAWRRGVPYIWASGTPGGWGGIVGRAAKGVTEGCWKCFRYHLDERAIESPAFESGPGIQPVGCFSPTFTGAGFDMDTATLQAVRLAVSTLCKGATDGYPDFDWDIGVVNLWADGKPIASDWKTYPLTRHLACDAHD